MNERILRRSFLQFGAALLLAPAKLLGAVRQGLVLCRGEADAVAEGQRIGVGTARLEGPASVEVCTHQTWTLVYTAGETGVRPGVTVGLCR